MKVHLDKYSLIHIKDILCILNGDHIDTVSRNKIKIRFFFSSVCFSFKLTAQKNKGAAFSENQLLPVMCASTAGDRTGIGSGCFPRLLVMRALSHSAKSLSSYRLGSLT